MDALKLFISILLLSGAPAITYGQSAVVASGGQGEGLKGSISYSVGQVADQHSTGGAGHINEGVQQPFEIFNPTTSTNGIARFEFSVYPNPVRDFIVIHTQGDLPDGLQYYILDIMGRNVFEGSIDRSLREISVTELMPSLYTLMIRHQGILIGASPIIKIE